MRFMMFVCPRPDFQPNDDLGRRTDEWVARFDASGQRVTGDILAGEADGAIVGDGPPDATAHIAGFDILECTSLAEATDVAQAHPMAEAGSIVVRPFWGD